jgi:hypothetical protein
MLGSQQKASPVQMSETQGSQLGSSATPVEQIGCEQVTPESPDPPSPPPSSPPSPPPSPIAQHWLPHTLKPVSQVKPQEKPSHVAVLFAGGLQTVHDEPHEAGLLMMHCPPQLL